MSGQKAVPLVGLALVLLTTPAVASPGIAGQLRSGEVLVLEREDRGGLVVTSADDPVIDLEEMEGADVVVRITPLDRAGLELGSGRVLVIGPSEHRRVRLRDELTQEALYDGIQLRVEVLQGAGRVMLAMTEANGRALQPQPDAAPLRRRAVQPPGVKPTSIGLIDKAEAAGTLDSETALLYRVFALFSDARLPVQYRGDDSNIEDSLYMAKVRDRFATLSPATQATLLPFLTPPAYQGSWANTAAGSPLTIFETPPPCQFFSDKWGRVDTSNNLVSVWYRLDVPNEALNAGALAQTIDATIWPKLSGLMTGHLPISDLGESCNGGNGRLDIYLTDLARSMTVPYTGCQKTPTFILLKRAGGNAFAVHEIFHAFQFSFVLAGCLTDEKYDWWTEASAEWAQDFVFPSDQQEHKAAPSFLSVPEQPLDLLNDYHEYGAYLLPFFVYRKTGSADFVRVAWENCASQSAVEALDQVMAGGFDKMWPDFARYNWNRKPVDDYLTWDGLHSAAHAVEVDVELSGEDKSADLNIELPRLSAAYYRFQFLSDVSSVAFWNGITFNLGTRDVPGGSFYDPKEASADQKKGVRVQALIKLNGQQDWQVADWTNLPYLAFCRDMLAERIDELVLIVSNSDYKDQSRTVKPPGMAPLVWVSNMGCWQWVGTATYTDTLGTLISATATWTRVAASQPAPFVSYKPEGTENWSVTGMCTGSGTLPILPEISSLLTYNFTPRTSSFRRVYVAVGGDTRQVSLTCPGPTTVPMGLIAWLIVPLPPVTAGIPGARFVKVNSDGTIMDDSYTPPDSDWTWKWHFEAKQQ